MEEQTGAIKMKVMAGASRKDILNALDYKKVVAFIKRDEEIEGFRTTEVFQPVLLSKEEIRGISKDVIHESKCDGNGIYVPCEFK
jgi:hypothetical protein